MTTHHRRRVCGRLGLPLGDGHVARKRCPDDRRCSWFREQGASVSKPYRGRRKKGATVVSVDVQLVVEDDLDDAQELEVEHGGA